MAKKKIEVQVWRCATTGDSELQHFLNDKNCTYVFGANKKLLGKKLYSQILIMIKNKFTK